MKLFSFEVRHPDYPTVIVSSIGPDSATMKAAREHWDLDTREWAAIASACTARKLGEAVKPTCRRCGKTIAEPGLCKGCEQVEAAVRRDAARIGSSHRRAGLLERRRQEGDYG